MAKWSAVSDTNKTLDSDSHCVSHTKPRWKRRSSPRTRQRQANKSSVSCCDICAPAMLECEFLVWQKFLPRSLSKICVSYNTLLDMSRYWIKLTNVEPYMRFVCLLKVSCLIRGDSRYSYDWPISNFQSKDLINIFDISFSHHKHNWTKWMEIQERLSFHQTLQVHWCCTEDVLRFLFFLFMI